MILGTIAPNVGATLLGNVAWSAGTTLYFGLSSTLPTYAGSNITEPSGSGYARVAITNDQTNFPAWVAGSSETTETSAVAITFPTSTGAWLAGASLAYLIAWSASTGGTPYACWTMSNPPSLRRLELQ